MSELLRNNKKLMSWYSYTENKDIDVNKITCGSNKKIWWLCPKGHCFDMTISHKMRNVDGCPFCSGHRVCDDNNLEVLYPELIKYWDNDKNGKNRMKDFTPSKSYNAYWICDEGHSYQMPINRRIKLKKCPICSGQRITIDNCLETVLPDIAKEWNYKKNGDLKPSDVAPGTHKKVWWKCSKCGHSWETRVYSRGITKTGCPQCDSEKRTSFPEQAILFYLRKELETTSRSKIDKYEIDVFIPSLNVGVEYDGEYHHSRSGSKEREARKNSKMISKGILLIRVKEKRKLQEIVKVEKKPYGYNIFYKYTQQYLFINDLMKKIFEIINCERDYHYNVDVDIEKDKNEIMNQYIVNEKNNSLLVKKPLAAKKWNYEKNGEITPDIIPYSSKKRFMFKCPRCNYEWESAVENVQDTEYCPNCVHFKGDNYLKLRKNKDRQRIFQNIIKYSFASVHPELLTEWDYKKNTNIDPNSITPGSNKVVWWICSGCNNNFKMSIKHRSTGSICQICANENRKKTKYKKVINLDTGEIYNSLKEVIDKYELNSHSALVACLKGRSKTCLGYRWSYYDVLKK